MTEKIRRVDLGPCEYMNGRGGCVYETYFETLQRLRALDRYKVRGGDFGSLRQCSKLTGLAPAEQCQVAAAVVYSDAGE